MLLYPDAYLKNVNLSILLSLLLKSIFKVKTIIINKDNVKIINFIIFIDTPLNK